MMAVDCITLTEAQEQGITFKVFEQLQHILPQHVRKEMRPIIQELVNHDDSVFNATQYLPGTENEHTTEENTEQKMLLLNNRIDELSTDVKNCEKKCNANTNNCKVINTVLNEQHTHFVQKEKEADAIVENLQIQIDVCDSS